MDGLWIGGMTEISRREVEEIDDQQDQSDEIVAPHDEHDIPEEKQVVEDEMAAYVTGRGDVGAVPGPELAYIA